uniref:Glycosyltransferase n=1 Tax=Fervidobacterium pennivorans TaxID=93466 RepID=A0A7V4CPF4_FERPE
MKVVMINDCAFVGETLLKYMPDDVDKLHIKRTRGFWSKTFGLALSILRAKGDVYHVHYLLQDCHIATRFGKRPLIGHAHGSDLREIIHTKMWGWIVKYNLRHCDKILVAQPTILRIAREYNDTAEYFPIPYDPQLFYPKPLPERRNIKYILIASPHDFRVKGTDKFIHACAKVDVPFKLRIIDYGKDARKARILAKKMGLKVEILHKVSHESMNKLYWDADLILGSFGVGQLDTVAVEAMACGRPVIHHILKKYFPTCPLQELDSIDHVAELINTLLTDHKRMEELRSKQLQYVSTYHNAINLSNKLVQIYDCLVQK